MLEDLKEQINEFVPESCQDVKVPRPYDPSLADQYIGIADFGKVRGGMTYIHTLSACVCVCVCVCGFVRVGQGGVAYVRTGAWRE